MLRGVQIVCLWWIGDKLFTALLDQARVKFQGLANYCMFVRARTKHCNAIALGLLRCTSVFIIKSQVYLLCCLDLDSGSCRVKCIYFLFGPRFTVMQGQGSACVNPGLLLSLPPRDFIFIYTHCEEVVRHCHMTIVA